MFENKSFIAKIAENILKITKPAYMDSKDKIDEFLAEKSNSSDKPVKSIFKSINFNGIEIFRYGKSESKNMIIYIHGGAYVNEINMQHHLFCYLIAKKFDVCVLAPAYPLAPNHKALETYDLMLELYEKLVKSHNIILMGDSAGGGFVLSFAQYLNFLKLPQPQKLIVFSPWVDISMSNSNYDSENDLILGEIGLKEIGKSWAGDLNVKDYRVSPIYGDIENHPDTVIFAGTSEIFYTDIEKYVNKLKNANVNVKFISGEGMFHIYPLFPIPEAKLAFEVLKEELSD